MQIVITPKRIVITTLLCLFAYSSYSLFDIKRNYALCGFSEKCEYKSRVAYADNAYFYRERRKVYKCLESCINSSGKISYPMYPTVEEEKLIEEKHFPERTVDVLQIGDDSFIVINNYGTEIRIKEAGKERLLTCIPECYLVDLDNMYYEDGYLYALSRRNKNWSKDVDCSFWARGSYNSDQRLIDNDVIMKIDISNDTCEFLYQTNDKRDRIVGYSTDTIAIANRSLLTIKNINDNSVYKRYFLGIKSNYIFEVCNNRIFVWDGSYKLIGSYDMQADMKE